MKIFEYAYALISIIMVGVATILTAPMAAYVFVRENKKLEKAAKLKDKLNAKDNI